MSALRNRSVGTELSLLDVKKIEELLDQINKLQQQVSSLQQQLNTVTEEKSVCGLDSPKQRTRQDCDGSVCVCGVGETEAVSTSTPECVCKGEEVEPFQDGDEHTDNGVFKVCLVQPMNCRTAPTPNTHITQEEADDSADDEVSLCAADDWWKESESYGEKSSVCSECGEPFSGPAALRVHTRTHTGDRRFICTCGKPFSYSSSLTRHQNQHCSHSSDSHSVRNVGQVKQRLFQCSFCGKQFSTKTHMTIHERLHTGKKPYECSQCSQAFARPDRLQEHRRVHTGEKPYECSHCGKHFALLGGLKRHRRTHTGEKPYKCTVCKKSFTQSTKLKIHLRTHTGERPYICADCGKTFARTEHLRTHQKIHSAGKRRHRAPRKGSVMSVAHTPEQQTAE